MRSLLLIIIIIFFLADERKYSGKFADGRFCGHGVYSYPNGSCYEGEPSIQLGLMTQCTVSWADILRDTR